MKPTRRGLVLCAVPLAALVFAFPSAASPVRTIAAPEIVAQYHPTGTGTMDSGMGGRFDDNDPMAWAGARMSRTYAFAGQMERIRAIEAKLEAQAYQGMLDGTYTPVVRYTDGTTNVAQLLAKKITAARYRKLSEAEAERFLTDRQADYERDIAARQMPTKSLTSACAYWVDSLYVVGGGVHASPADLDQVRATCALEIGKTEKIGSLTSNEQRYTVGEALATIGAMFRKLAVQPGDTADAVAGARSMFKKSFGYAIDEVPISRFPCVLSEQRMTDCDTIMTRYAARLPEIAHRNS